MNKNNQLSLAGKIVRMSLTGSTVRSTKVIANILLVISVGYVVHGYKSEDPNTMGFPLGFGFLSLLWFTKSGYIELLEKEYVKKQTKE